MSSLSLRHVYKIYPNGKKAVRDFSMEIADREFIVFVGPSGCGKSTTLRMIAGLEEVTTGEIRIDGALVNDVEPKDRDIAMVFQNYALYPHITVYENMAFALKLRKVPNEEIHRRVIESAEILGITEYLSKKPREMSGGQRQRVALGRAIVREPKVFLLDEPLSNLDAKLRTEMRAQISKLHARLKTTFIYVTHDQTEAMTMGTRIVVMKDGVIEQIDTPRRLYHAPNSRFVAAFIGSPQMNFYRATLEKHGGTVTLTLPDAGAVWTLPFGDLEKVSPAYLDGAREITLGIRAEHISVGDGPCSAACTVSHVEELGDETLVYGDLAGGADSVTETRSSVVFRIHTESGTDLSAGDRLSLRFDLRYAHFFDGESGASIRPPIPKENLLPAVLGARTVTVEGVSFPLPPALTGKGEGEVTLGVPLEAVKTAEAIENRGNNNQTDENAPRLTVKNLETVGDETLTTLALGNLPLFARGTLGAVRETVRIALDWKAVRISAGERVLVEPMKSVCALGGSIVRERIRAEGGKKQTVYRFEVEGVRLPIPEELLQNLLHTAGLSVLKKHLRYEIPPSAVRIGEGPFRGSVLRTVDYGDGERYAILLVGGRELIAHAEAPLEGQVAFDLCLGEITLVDDDLDVVLL